MSIGHIVTTLARDYIIETVTLVQLAATMALVHTCNNTLGYHCRICYSFGCLADVIARDVS
jgi:hypothetical protein